ncbi:fibronectin type III domain-containing protein [Tenuifilum thalassicum]|uniref:T9SS type A sorting domain-containing protein n=1 Tax=Tenuifilum thalassicum TaxID=2590900 RepID=A0A7D4BDQ2_9BACT|nr:fibronectin type III domain-containing protein [Tenuifilum thalassicum]QKG79518.1 T9SS type A sorting domain-containing protein [Tenuifilum thalassicum]
MKKILSLLLLLAVLPVALIAQDGTTCENALDAVVGTNTADCSSGDQWFKYTATLDGVMKVSTCGLTNEDTYVKVFDGCGGQEIGSNDDYCNRQSEITIDVISGVTYYIVWENWYTSAVFDWTIEEYEPQPGETCNSALDASSGTNTADCSSGSQWFKYTATRDGKIVLSSCGLTTDSTDVSVYQSCGGSSMNLNDLCSVGQSEIQFNAVMGTTYYINWIDYNNGTFNWTLSEEDWGPGETCTTAIEAVAGTNTADCTGGDRWFKYTATRDGKIAISNCGLTGDNTGLEIYTDCGSYPVYDGNYCGSGQRQVQLQGQVGVTYYIRWTDGSSGTFDWTLSEEDWGPGETCTTAIEAVAGTNTADCTGGDRWFKYTATRDGKIAISNCGLTGDNTGLEIYTDCGSYPVSYGNSCGSGQSQVQVQGQVGVTYYIRWTDGSSGTFDWTLSEEDWGPGETCTTAIEAVAGTNTADCTGGDRWFKYTATRDGKIAISNCGLTGDNTGLGIYTDCGSYPVSYGNSCGSGQRQVQLQGQVGVTYYIRWTDGSSGTFDWTLSEEDWGPGETCTTAIEAVAGTNTADCTGGDRWFKYTATRDGKIAISNCGLTGDNTGLEIYTDCGSNPVYYENYCGSGQRLVKLQGQVGITYYIKWTDGSSGTFDWTLSEEDWGPGETCTTAIEAVAGTNTADCTGGDRWFKYTATRDGKIAISNCGLTGDNTGLEIYTDCGSYPVYYGIYCGSGQRLVKLQGQVGITYYIKWSDYSSGTFDWTLSEEDWGPGETCTTAIEAVAGTNTADCTGGDRWFKYTATRDGKIAISNCGLTGDDTALEIYTDCGSYPVSFGNSCGSGQRQVQLQGQVGVTYYIRWTVGISGTFDWTLSEEDWGPGETCTTAIEAVAGTNTADCTGGDRWFKYTATRDGKITISNCGLTGDNTRLEIYTDCGSYPVYYGNYCGSGQRLVKLQGQVGVTYYIRWTDGSSGTFDWTLSEEDWGPGETCTTAIEAVAGTNTADCTGGDRWFKYTATRDGKITISNCGLTGDDTALGIYTDCGSYPVYYENYCGRGQRLVKLQGQVGITYYIRWYDYSSGTFDWTLSEEDWVPGETCTTAIEAVAGTNTADCTGGDRWFKYTATRDGKITISNCGLTGDNTGLEIYTDCGSYPVYYENYCGSGQRLVKLQGQVGITYYIKWTDGSSGTFDWTLSEEDWGPGESCTTAIEAVAGTNTADCTGGDRWFKYTATRDGKIAISNCGLTGDNTGLDIYTDCRSYPVYYGNYCGSGQRKIQFPIQAGTTYYIRWTVGSSGTFDWTLSEEDWGPGETCKTAIEAVAGTNTADCTGGDRLFKYTATIDGVLTVSTCGLTNGDTYVKVYDECGGLEIGRSDDYCGYQSQLSIPVTLGNIYYIKWDDSWYSGQFDWSISLKPNTPANLSINNVTQTGFTLQWQEVPGADGYIIDIATDEEFTSFVSGYAGKEVLNENSAEITGLTPNTTYYIRIKSFEGSDESDYSSPYAATTIKVVPQAPVAFAASDVTSAGFTASWGSVTEADGYKIDVSSDADFSSFVLGYNGRDVQGATSHDVQGLSANTTYYYRVRAYNNGGDSDFSNIITVTTLSTGINPNSYNAVSVFPNPSDGIFNVDLGGSRNATVQVIDLTGRIVKQFEVKNQSTFKLNIESKGLYLLRIRVDKTTAEFKVSVQ